MKTTIDVIDNKDFIIKSIRKEKDKRISELKDVHKARLKELTQVKKDSFTKRKNALEQMHKQELETLEKQMTSNYDLTEKQELLEKQKELYEKVLQAVKKLISSGSRDGEKVFAALAKKLDDASDKEIASFLTPKGISLSDYKSADKNDDLKITGIISKNESVEYSIEELLTEKKAEIYKLIMDELSL